MQSRLGLTLITLLLNAVTVYGQACPDGLNVAQMCVPGTFSGDRVLIDTASYDPSVSNCSCTFGTSSSVLKLVTYVAPNYPECNSAVRFYSASGNSIRFHCLMSGTYLDTSMYNVGVTTFEKYAELYDKNYCLMLESAGSIGDIVTVTCTGENADVQQISTPDIAQNITGTAYNTTDSTNSNTDSSPTNTSTEASSSAITTDSMISASVTHGESTTIDVSTTNTSTNEIINDTVSSSLELSAGNYVTNKNVYDNETAKTEVSTESTLLNTRQHLEQSSYVEVATTTDPQNSTSVGLNIHRFESDITNIPEFKPDEMSIDTKTESINESSTAANNITVNNTDIVTEDITVTQVPTTTSNTNERTNVENLTAVVTGTVLFNGGGTNSSKTIQTIDAVASDILHGRDQLNFAKITTSTTTPTYDSSFNSNIHLSKVMASISPIFMSGTTQPVDISNVLVMEPNSSLINFEPSGGDNNISDTSSADYSLQFPFTEPSQDNTSDIASIGAADINGTNALADIIDMATSYGTNISMNSNYSNINDYSPVDINLPHETAESDIYSIKMIPSDILETDGGVAISSNSTSENVLKTSPFTTKEVRFLLESTEPTDTVENIATRAAPKKSTTDLIADKSSVSNFKGTTVANEFNVIQETSFVPFSTGKTDVTTEEIPGVHLQERSAAYISTQRNSQTEFSQSTTVTTAPSMFDSTEGTKVSTVYGNMTNYESNKTNEMLLFDQNVGNEFNLTKIPTTPSPLDFVYKESIMEPTQANKNAMNTEVLSTATRVSPQNEMASSRGLETATDYIPGKYNSFESSTYYFPEQKPTDPTVGVSYYETANSFVANVIDRANETGSETVADKQPVNSVVQVNASSPTIKADENNLHASNATEENYLSTLQDHSWSELNTTEGIPETSTENLDNVSFISQDNAYVSEINRKGLTPDVAVKQSFTKQDITNISAGTTSWDSHKQGNRQVDNMSLIGQNSAPVTETSMSEASMEITTNILNHQSLLNEENGILPSEINVTEVSRESTSINIDHLSLLNERDRILPSEINAIDDSLESTTQNIDHLSLLNEHNRILPSDINATEVSGTSTIQNIDHLPLLNEHNGILPSDINATEVSRESTFLNIDHLSLLNERDRILPSEINATDDSLKSTTQNIDHLSLLNDRNRILPSEINATDVPLESTTQNIDHLSLLNDRNRILPSEINAPEVTRENATQNIDHLSLLNDRKKILPSEINATDVSLEVTTQNIDHLSLLNDRSRILPSDINATDVSLESTTQIIDHLSLLNDRNRILPSDINATDVWQESTTQIIDHLSFVHRETTLLSEVNDTDLSLETGKEHVSLPEQMDTGLPSVDDARIFSESVNESVATSTDQTLAPGKTTDGYGFNSGIDRNNLLAFTEAVPLNVYQSTTYNDIAKDSFLQTKQDIKATAPGTDLYTDKIGSKDGLHVEASPISKESYINSFHTDNAPTTRKVTTTETTPSNVEDVMIHEKISHEEVVLQDTVPQGTSQPSTYITTENSYLQTDILANIENQIITEERSLEAKSSTNVRSAEGSTTKEVPGSEMEKIAKETRQQTTENVAVTTNKTDTLVKKQETPPEIIPPEPIIPKRPSVTEDKMRIPTTPDQSFNIVDESLIIPDEAVPNDAGRKKETVGNSGMNVYFDTGKSKDSPYEMNNDTYIIVVGAIVGLVVLAVVIGILCHNSRKTRSEKVNISGDTDPSSHQNQVFDSEAADAEQGTSVVKNGVEPSSGLPEQNGGSNGTIQNESNGNIEL